MRWSRREREEDMYAGSLAPDYPQQAPDPYSDHHRPPRQPEPDELVEEVVEPALVERPPSLMHRVGQSLAETRRRVLPLPDEVIDQFLGNGERVLHNDHPSFRSFVVQNTLLFTGFLILAVLFLGISFRGSLLVAAGLLLILCVVMLVLFLKRLGDRYTSYVVTDTRIMRISGIISRRAHSIPWVRVTDLTVEQSFSGRLFGYATLHIESANEDSGLRDLDGVSDPMVFNQFVVDMVVAKQGATAPKWEETGEPAPVSMGKGLRRIRMSRRRRSEEDAVYDRGPDEPHAPRTDDRGRRGPDGERRDQRRRSATVAYGDDGEPIDPETLAEQLRAASQTDLPWRR